MTKKEEKKPSSPAPEAAEAAREAEELRRQLRETRQQLDEAAREAREARQQVKALQSERHEAGREVEGLRGQLRETRQQLEEAAREMREARKEIKALQAERHEAGREMEGMQKQTREAQKKALHEALDGTEKVRREIESTQGQLREVKRLFQEASRQLLAALEGEVALARRDLLQGRKLLEGLPLEAQELRQRLAEMRNRLPEAERQLQQIERASGEARQELETVAQESRQAQERLGAVREQAGEAELRLALVQQELPKAEKALDEARHELDRMGEGVKEARVQEAVVLSEPPVPEPRNRLGVVVGPGVVVAEVQKDTPASAAGVEKGDVVRAVNGVPILTALELRHAVHVLPEGEEVTLLVDRGGATQELRARLAAPPAEEGDHESEGRNRLGVVVGPGVVVAEVLPGTPAAEAGVAPGDVVRSANGDTVLTGEHLREIVRLQPEHAELTLAVGRGTEEREVKARLDGPAPAAS